ncbi:UNVERIFIED_CONTAM: hypothetical protein FKN15_054456 [Acipenser sinensis]
MLLLLTLIQGEKEWLDYQSDQELAGYNPRCARFPVLAGDPSSSTLGYRLERKITWGWFTSSHYSDPYWSGTKQGQAMAEDARKLRAWILENAGLEAKSLPIAIQIMWMMDSERWEAYQRKHTPNNLEEGLELVLSYLEAAINETAAQVAGPPAEGECLLSPSPPAVLGGEGAVQPPCLKPALDWREHPFS